MVVGFNHNFRYKGEVYHIQTEDSGVKSPNIVTLLYQGGTILASKKTSYADITKVDNLEQVVEELMKEQHKNMLRSLKSGEFDSAIERFKAGKAVAPAAEQGQRIAESPPAVAPQPSAPGNERPNTEPVREPEPEEPPVIPVAPQVEPRPVAKPVKTQPVAKPGKETGSVVEASLDEVILSYLMGDEK